jgi:hypothetical protein
MGKGGIIETVIIGVIAFIIGLRILSSVLIANIASGEQRMAVRYSVTKIR